MLLSLKSIVSFVGVVCGSRAKIRNRPQIHDPISRPQINNFIQSLATSLWLWPASQQSSKPSIWLAVMGAPTTGRLINMSRLSNIWYSSLLSQFVWQQKKDGIARLISRFYYFICRRNVQWESISLSTVIISLIKFDCGTLQVTVMAQKWIVRNPYCQR